MPELPEVETVKRGMEKILLNNKIQHVYVMRHDLRVVIPEDFASLLLNKICLKMERRGKYIILFFDDSIAAVLHLGMSGRIRIYDSTQPFALEKHDHVHLVLKDGSQIVFNDSRRFGMFYTLDAETWKNEKSFAAMGPEPLEEWNGTLLFNALQNKKAPIKIALLDQRIVSGLGNIYVCEALFCASINPTRAAGALTKAQCDKLVSCARNVLEKAIEAGGSTLRDYKKTDGSLGYFQHQFSVYDQENKNCPKPSCTGIIKRIVQAGRSTYYCPACQK